MARPQGWLESLSWVLSGGPYRVVPCPVCGADVVIEPSPWRRRRILYFGPQPARQVTRACAVDGRAPHNAASKALAAGADPDKLLGRWRR